MLVRLFATFAAAFAIFATTPAGSPWQSVSATSYSPCSSGTITASGEPVRFGGVAMNTVPLGTHIEISPAAFGRSTFTVNDRIGSGSQLDIFTPNCQQAIDFGRRMEQVKVISGKRWTARERKDADERARQPLIVWLQEPIVDPVSKRKIVGYDPATLDQAPWLDELLAAADLRG